MLARAQFRLDQAFGPVFQEEQQGAIDLDDLTSARNGVAQPTGPPLSKKKTWRCPPPGNMRPTMLVELRYAAISLYGGIFFAGYEMGDRYVTGDRPTHLLNDETVGKLTRTDECSVLFARKGDKQIVLFRCDGIKSIKSIK